jgi:hypothetical protein
VPDIAKAQNMTGEQIAEVLGGFVALGVGVQMIVTQRATFSDEDDEPYMWVYGWRAVLVGVVAVLTSLVFFASAAKCINWFH